MKLYSKDQASKVRSKYLALDVGFSFLGWAVYDPLPDTFSHSGVVFTSKEPSRYVVCDYVRRCQELAGELESLMQRFKLSVVFAEVPTGGAKSSKASVQMAMAVGVVTAVVFKQGVTFIPILPIHSKRIVTPKGSVSKEDVQKYIEGRYGTKLLPKLKERREHIADAMMTVEVARRDYPLYFRKAT